ncbi:hypothetical protein [Alicyclobacillus sp. ALC3]|uniref:hypothetical protein n=1 Tax=Alicyclobacillus sp. ALC3 TaxID=2796143 RepID=UPI002378E157|nr:hypothetical protein [Alicyclobacillus sp. ALC3]WDL96432.1 hypothetical protein JC200_19225 [Alicyclobacillus sp. ALC3]
MESVREAGFMLLFRYPRYGRLWLSRVVSGFGDQAGWIAFFQQLYGSHGASLVRLAKFSIR